MLQSIADTRLPLNLMIIYDKETLFDLPDTMRDGHGHCFTLDTQASECHCLPAGAGGVEVQALLLAQVASMVWLRLREVQIISAYYELRVDHPVLLLTSQLSPNCWLTFQHPTFPFLLLRAEPRGEKTNRQHCLLSKTVRLQKQRTNPLKSGASLKVFNEILSLEFALGCSHIGDALGEEDNGHRLN